LQGFNIRNINGSLMSTAMNTPHEPLLLRARLVEACLRSHADTFADNPGFLAQRDQFRILLEQAVSEEGRAEPDPAVRREEATRNDLAQALRIVSGPLESWAAVIGDEPLRLLAGACPEGWTLRGNRLGEHALTILETGRDALTQGAGQFGLTSGLLDALEARLEAHQAVPEASRSAIRELEGFRRAVIDPLVRLYLDRAPAFCAAYRTACRDIPAKHARSSAGESGRSKGELPAEEMLSA